MSSSNFVGMIQLACAVMDWLAGYDVDRSRLAAKNAEGLAKNRRVELVRE